VPSTCDRLSSAVLYQHHSTASGPSSTQWKTGRSDVVWRERERERGGIYWMLIQAETEDALLAGLSHSALSSGKFKLLRFLGFGLYLTLRFPFSTISAPLIPCQTLCRCLHPFTIVRW